MKEYLEPEPLHFLVQARSHSFLETTLEQSYKERESSLKIIALDLYALGKARLALYLRLAAGLLNLGLNILLIPLWGVMGVVVATGSSMVLVGIVEVLLVTRYTRSRIPIHFQGRILFISVASLLPTMVIGNGATLVGLFGKASLFAVSWLLISLLGPPIDHKQREMLRNINLPLYRLAQCLWA